MTKVLIAMCAMAAVMACTKTEATFEQPGEISFSPVSRYNTKAAVTGTNFTANQNFYVFANTTDNEKYFSNILFEADGTNKDGEYQVYKGNPSQFWPNVKSLKFAGYTVSGNVGATSSSILASMNENFETMTLTSYQQPLPTENEANDLMWFFENNSGSGYDKNTDYVNPTMKHALSWITINIKAESQGLLNYWNNLTITEVEFANLITTNTVALGTDAVWTEVAAPSPAVSVDVMTTDKVLTTSSQEFAEVANNTIVIPQTPVDLNVTYSYKSPADNNVTITETKPVSLKFDGENKWAAGTHYTYELTIGANEIKIAPKSTEWATGTGSGLNQTIK